MLSYVTKVLVLHSTQIQTAENALHFKHSLQFIVAGCDS